MMWLFSASATTHVVTNSALSTGPGTVYHAMQNAGSGDTVLFSTCLDGDTIQGIHIVITVDLVLIGQGIGHTIIDGRNYNFVTVDSSATLHVSGITFLRCDRNSGDKGAVQVNSGTAYVSNCLFNNANGDVPTRAGVYGAPGTIVHLYGCTAYNAGLVQVHGSATVEHCHISKTEASAIVSYTTAASDSLIIDHLVVDSCTISYLLIYSECEYLRLTNSVVRDNSGSSTLLHLSWQSDSAHFTGNTFYNNHLSSARLIYDYTLASRWTNNTIANNSTTSNNLIYIARFEHHFNSNTTANNSVDAGYSVWDFGTILSLYFANNIYYGNTGNDLKYSSGVLLNQNNFVQTCLCPDTFYSASDPLLDTAGVSNNGGAVPTLALLAGSPAIDSASASFSPATDGRGFPRDGSPDIGAFEFNAPATCMDAVMYGVSATDAALGLDATIRVNGVLNDATAWHLYADSCGGTAVDSNTTGLFTVSVSSTTSYFVRAEGGCVSAGSCAEVVVHRQTELCAGVCYVEVEAVSDSTNICTGAEMARAVVSYGTAPFTYSWSNGSTADTAIAMTAMTHAVTVTDSGGCTDTSSVHTTFSAPLASNIDTIHLATCLGANGLAVVSASQGFAPYSYTWSTGGSGDSLNTPTGTYTFTVTDSLGCQLVDSATIGGTDTLDAQLSVSHMDCALANDGKLVPYAPNGLAPYSYSWSNASTADSLTGLGQGTYTVTIVDANNCYDTVSASMWFVCEQVGNLRPMNKQDVSVRLTWDTICGVKKYKIFWKVAGPGPWDVAIKESNVGSLNLTGLTPGTTYTWSVKADCGPSGWGSTAVQQQFTTLTAPCNAPGGLASPTVGLNKAKLTWTQEANAHLYRIRYRVSGAPTWTVVPKDPTWSHHWLTGLAQGVNYEWEIRTVCEAGLSTGSPWSTTQYFTTASPKSGHDWSVSQEVVAGDMRLIPNPNNGRFAVLLEGYEGNLELSVYDATGRLVEQRSTIQNGRHSLDIANNGPGFYVLRIAGKHGVQMQRVVVQ